MSSMKAIVFDGEVRYTTKHPRPEPRKGHALVRVRLAGICNTDLEITRGYMGYKGIPGHEFVGTVKQVNGPESGMVGRRVVGEINLGCGKCPTCLAGLRNHCPTRTVLGILGHDGALAEYLTLPVDNLLVVPKNVPDEDAVFAEPLAAAFEILEGVHIKPTDAVLVMGDGKLGLLCAMALATTQAEVSLVGRHKEKLAIAERHGIITHPAEGFAAESAYDVVVEATGSATGLALAMQYVRPRGTIVLKSTVADTAGLNLAPVVIKEIEVVGSRCGPFGPALKAMSAGLIRPSEHMVTAVYKAGDALKAFKRAGEKGALKVIVDFR